ncbi:MAG: hypothetical protein U0790_00670 [Isosphaeraceae bacterium]
MSIPLATDVLAGLVDCLPEKPRARLVRAIGELCEEFPYPGTRFLIEEAALGRFRRDDAAGAIEQFRKFRSLRASFQWETIRGLEIEEQAAKLMSRPAATVRLLETSVPGIRWLLQRWGWLVMALEKNGTWDEPLQRQAQRLCGIPADFESADPKNIRAGSKEERLALARGEIARLEGLLTPEMAVSNEADKQAAIEGSDIPDDSTYRRLVRAEKDAKRLHDRALSGLKRLRDRIEAERDAAEAEESPEPGDASGESCHAAPRTANRKAGRRPRNRRIGRPHHAPRVG